METCTHNRHTFGNRPQAVEAQKHMSQGSREVLGVGASDANAVLMCLPIAANPQYDHGCQQDTAGRAREAQQKGLPAVQLRHVLRRTPAHDIPAWQRRQRLRAGPAVVHSPGLGFAVVPRGPLFSRRIAGRRLLFQRVVFEHGRADSRRSVAAARQVRELRSAGRAQVDSVRRGVVRPCTEHAATLQRGERCFLVRSHAAGDVHMDTHARRDLRGGRLRPVLFHQTVRRPPAGIESAIVDPCWKSYGQHQASSLNSRCIVMTVAQAIEAFAAAGNDIDALEKAIGEASYLDASPGEDRQKLRGWLSPQLPPPQCSGTQRGCSRSGRDWQTHCFRSDEDEGQEAQEGSYR